MLGQLTPDTLSLVLQYWPRYRWAPSFSERGHSKEELLYWWVKVYDCSVVRAKLEGDTPHRTKLVAWFGDNLAEIFRRLRSKNQKVRFVRRFES